MNDRLIALAQIFLSFIIIIGYFAIKVAEGLKLLSPVSNLTELVMLVAFFWFQRQRQSTENHGA